MYESNDCIEETEGGANKDKSKDEYVNCLYVVFVIEYFFLF